MSNTSIIEISTRSDGNIISTFPAIIHKVEGVTAKNHVHPGHHFNIRHSLYAGLHSYTEAQWDGHRQLSFFTSDQEVPSIFKRRFGPLDRVKRPELERQERCTRRLLDPIVAPSR